MKTLFLDSSTSLRDLGHFSRYLESVLHSPNQQCLVLTFYVDFGDKHHILKDFRCLTVKNIAKTCIMFVRVTRGVRSDGVYL